MGPLFRKLFITIFLAQLVTAWGVGVLFWLTRAEHDHRPHSEAMAPPPPPSEAPATGPADMPHPVTPGPLPGPHGIPWPPILVGLLASLLFAALLARHLSRPIVGLRRAFEDVGAGRFEPEPRKHAPLWPDELSDLGGDFERTAGKVRMLIQNQRKLLHDVSHEVRSPLARMQLAIDLARQQPDRATETMARLERECGRINHLVEELLTLSRLEAGGWGKLADEVDLAELLHEMVADANFEASARPCTVTLKQQDEADFTVRGHAGLLQRAIENVIRNAIRHTAPASNISVTLFRAGTQICVSVEDCGPGVPEAELERMFVPFVRLQERASNEGYGLGLAITRQTLEAHCGTVSAGNRAEGGLRVELMLPAPRTP